MNLYLHIGHGKTGSSFIQSWFACNAAQLASAQKLLYPLKDPGSELADTRALHGTFNQGNGWLLDRLLETTHHPRRQRRWLKGCMSDLPWAWKELNGVVFSFEGWAKRIPQMLDPLRDLAGTWRVETIQLFLVVRDPLEHACSAYSQMVKRHGYVGSLDQWLQGYRFTQRLLESLEAVHAAGSDIRLHAMHYGRHQQELLTCCQEWLGLDPAEAWSALPFARVNRSLSEEELRVMRILNERIGVAASRVGERFVNQLPDLTAARLQPSPGAVNDFLERWRQPVDRINQLLPEDARIVLEPPALASVVDRDQDNSPIEFSADQLKCLVDALVDIRIGQESPGSGV